MIPGVLTVGGFVWLALFIGLASAVNWVLKKPKLNGALLYCWVVGSVSIYGLGVAWFTGTTAKIDAAANWFGGLLFPFLVAFYFARKFTRRKKGLVSKPATPAA